MMSAPPLIHELTLEFKAALSFAELLRVSALLGGGFERFVTSYFFACLFKFATG